MSAPSVSKGGQSESKLILLNLPSGHEGKREQSNQTVSDYPTSLSIICLHCGLASCFYLLPVWLVTDGVFGGVPRQSFQTLILLSELPVQAQFPPPSMNRSRRLPKNANLIETLRATEQFHLHIADIKRQGIELRNSLLSVNEGKEANSREPEWHCSLTAFSHICGIYTQTWCDVVYDSSILSELQKSVVKETVETTKKLIQSGNWHHIWDREHVSKYIWQSSLWCWNRSVGYALPCQEELMHKQHCHIYIGIPAECFHYCAVILTTSAEGTWQYRHNTCS